jgi:putative ABC transport system permease protein
VTEKWRPTPRFFDLTQSHYGDGEQVYLPFSTSRALKLGSSGDMTCWGDEPNDDPEGSNGLNAPCAWIQYWVQLDSAEKEAAYRQYLINYSDQQRKAGRFERPTNTRLSDVMTWLDENKVVPGDVRLQTWLAFGFLLVCLLNTVGLLLAKFLRRGSEIGARRACTSAVILSRLAISGRRSSKNSICGIAGIAIFSMNFFEVRMVLIPAWAIAPSSASCPIVKLRFTIVLPAARMAIFARAPPTDAGSSVATLS